MADENDMKTSNAAGLSGTQTPVKSPAAVSTLFSPSPSILAAADAALERQEAFRLLPEHEQVRRMANFMLYGGIGDDR